MKKLILFPALLLIAANVYAESIQLSTYYPSPFGLYDRLRLVPRAALSDPCDSGTIYVRNTDNSLQLCGAGSTWGSFAGPWTESGNNIYATNTNANVGIGTTAPTERLHVANGDILLDDHYSIKWGGGSASIEGENPNNKLHFTTNNIERMIIDNNGKVGIGTAAPNRELDVTGSTRLRGHLLMGDGDPTNNAVFVAPSNGWQGFVFRVPSPGNNLDNYDGSTFTDLMTISPSGKVGIGIITPNNLIQVKDLINFDNARYGTLLGYQAGNVNTGNYNTFVGYNSGLANTTGYESTFVGQGSGQANSTGYENAFFGQNSGYSNTTGYRSAFLGYKSGYSNTMGANNIFLGYKSGYSNISGNNNIIIGNAIDAPNPTTSNFLTIGGIINGDLSTGNVGIGTTAPGAKLDIAGNIKISDGTQGAGKVLTSDSSGLSSWQGYQGSLVFNNANQSIPTNSSTILLFNSQDYDSSGCHDNISKLTVPSGVTKVKLSARIYWESPALGTGSRSIYIRKNGGSNVSGVGGPASTDVTVTIQETSTPVLNVVGGDYFEVLVVHGYGSNIDAVGGINYTWFSMEIIQ
jgi:hypothetical protein